MKVTHVEFSALYNMGDYNNEKIGFRASLDEGDTPEAVVEALREKAIALNTAHEGTVEELYKAFYNAKNDLRKINKQLAEATAEWNRVAEFLRAQGIKADAVDLKVFMPQLPPAEEEVEICF